MNTLFTIVANGKKFPRQAWTGGTTPNPRDFPCTKDEIAVYTSLMEEQIAESGGLDLWACAGTTANERLAMFAQRALLDTWAMFRDTPHLMGKL